MGKKLSYYYMSSSCMTTYNENGNIKSKQHNYVNDNGNTDYYHKESVIENNNEKIIKEEGNKELEINQLYLNKKYSGGLNSWFLPKGKYQQDILTEKNEETDPDKDEVEKTKELNKNKESNDHIEENNKK